MKKNTLKKPCRHMRALAASLVLTLALAMMFTGAQLPVFAADTYAVNIIDSEHCTIKSSALQGGVEPGYRVDLVLEVDKGYAINKVNVKTNPYDNESIEVHPYHNSDKEYYFAMPECDVYVSAECWPRIPDPDNLHWDESSPNHAKWEYDDEAAGDVRRIRTVAKWRGGNGERSQNAEINGFANSIDFSEFMNQHGEGLYSFSVLVDADSGSGYESSNTVWSDETQFYTADIGIVTLGEAGETTEEDGGRVDFTFGDVPRHYTENSTIVYPEDSEMAFEAIPDPGYEFLGLTVTDDPKDLVTEGTKAAFTLDKSVAVTATFRKNGPKSAVSLDFGQKHAALASTVAAKINEASEYPYNRYGKLQCTLNGSVITVQFPKKNAKERHAYEWMMASFDFLDDGVEGYNKDAGEKPLREFAVGKKSASQYSDYDEVDAEWEAARNADLGDSLSLNVLWMKPATAASFKVEAPVCGTEIAINESGRYPFQEPIPEILTDDGSTLELYETRETYRWFNSAEVGVEDFNAKSDKWIIGKMDAYIKCVAGFPVLPKFGYFVDPDALPTVRVNGADAKVKYISADEGCIVAGYVDVSHNWNDGEVTKEPTEAADGAKTFTCAVCGLTKTEVIPKKGYAPGADPNQKGEDGTPAGKGASAAVAENAIMNAASDEGPAGTKYAPLKLMSTKQSNKAVAVKWAKVGGATKYVVYGNLCGKANKMQKVGTSAGSAMTVSMIAGKALAKGKYYKFIVVALDNNNQVVSTSKVIHVATKGGKVGNHKKVTVKKAVIKKAKKLKKGKTLKLKAKAVKAKLKVKNHRKVFYESSNPAVATVSKAGVVKGVKKGTCYIYAYAQNGVSKKIKVVVK